MTELTASAIPLRPSNDVWQFATYHGTSYAGSFGRIQARRWHPSFNVAAFLFGPLWAAWRGLWSSFYLLVGIYLGVIALAFSWWPSGDERSPPLLAGLIACASTQLLFGFVANRVYRSQYYRWRVEPTTPSGVSAIRLLFGAMLMIFAFGLLLYQLMVPDALADVATFPVQSAILDTTTSSIDAVVTWMTVSFGPFFDSLTGFLNLSLSMIESVFVATPWPIVFLAIVLLSYKRGGIRLAALTAGALAYIGVFGLWATSMETVALVVTSVIICVLVGMPLGLLCAKQPKIRRAMEPLLDVMQTLPTFVYLIPAIAFFSIGKPPGLVATIIFALPPMIRLTALGIDQVPQSMREAADAYGATPLQALWKVELPLAMPSIRMGMNQTIMMSLSMVVIAAMIGAGGLGQPVLRSLQYLQTGQGFVAGFAIVIVAMVLDKLVRNRPASPKP